MPNRLASETSPYLLQHKDNPVDWYPWGAEALERARSEDRPILLSVGYSACHWCHVMEHESFADPEIANLMNGSFVNIKVDREERPDIDSIYMTAVQQMTGHGGWPMTVFLTPQGEPFYGGTYFPPDSRHGLPSFRQVLLGVRDAYLHRRGEVHRTAAELSTHLIAGVTVNPEAAPLEKSMLHRAFHLIAARFDSPLGGFGGAPKFPQPMTLDFLLRYWYRTGSEEALAMVDRTLEGMAAGGIHDQIGGGFHRYSVDARWLVPHFEKMLYDNALLGRTYLRAFQVTDREDFRRVTEEILGFVEREMLHAQGGFFSSLDADSEGIEGKFYVWSAREIDSALGPEEGRLFRLVYGVTEGGNWEGSNILNRPRRLDAVAEEAGVEVAWLEEVIERTRCKLYEIRSRRVWPGRDEKIIMSWNAMMLHTFAESAKVLESDRYRKIAVANAEFLLRDLRVDGRLLRTWRDGSSKIDGFLEDHALLLEALLAVYEATFDLRWVEEARWIGDQIIEHFWSADEEVFYDTRKDGERLVVRPRDIHDNAMPSGTSSAVQGLIRLARLTGVAEYESIALRVLGRMADVACQIPQAFGHLLGALAAAISPPLEIAIVGDAHTDETHALLRGVRRRFLPDATIAFRPFDSDEQEISRRIPLLAGRTGVERRATAYVCEQYTCLRPVTSAEELESELDSVLKALR